ncbi:DUF1853 family protein [Vogesella sp. LYT5W]|uniref:DUF1853 family protein n=1 Tax=Vogesella margarita TaxID=2984199 RepID=A0ABT5IKR4_9NEIS|nr:DUF1853 family protein [Vogesella margarita]MDC7712758.1 DUF1853 family protein [Vogesella margarita]
MPAANLAALHTPAVRDLAWLLTSASPWQDSADIDPARLLGAQGWPQLLALDAVPQPLLAYLAAHPVRRLGFYAERLLAFWFGLAPHIELVAANLPVRDGGKTVGEFDFLLRIDGVPLHLEAASKFYLQLEGGAWVGASLRDALLLKAGKTRQQLQLSRHPAACLPVGFAGCEVAARTRGWLFSPPSALMTTLAAPLNPHANRGWWIRCDDDWPQRAADSRWCQLPRLRWLAPALLDGEDTCSLTELQLASRQFAAPQLVAELRPRDDGRWQEVARGFVAPCDWPQPALLAPLLARLEAA